jgi:hypothetical protein
MPKLPAPLRKFITDKHDHVALWQTPNAPLTVWAIFTILSHLLHRGNARSAAELIGHAAIIVWAILEITSGASYFRRTLGAIVLLLTLLSVLR